jgi:hypothetical protein
MEPITKSDLAKKLYNTVLLWLKVNNRSTDDLIKGNSILPISSRTLRALKAGELVLRASKVKAICQSIGMDFYFTETYFVKKEDI